MVMKQTAISVCLIVLLTVSVIVNATIDYDISDTAIIYKKGGGRPRGPIRFGRKRRTVRGPHGPPRFGKRGMDEDYFFDPQVLEQPFLVIDN